MLPTLIVDDYAPNLFALEVALEPLALSVVSASSLEEAARLLAERDFGLAICDFYLGGRSAAELIARTRRPGSKNARVPFIIVSGADAGDPALAHVMQLPRVFFVQKPYSMSQLQDTIRKVLAQREMVSAAR